MTARFVILVLLLACLTTGCYTNIYAPGAVGKVVDAETGAPVRGAHITRPQLQGGFVGGAFVPSEGLPAATVVSDKSGRFDLGPSTRTVIAFMYSHNPKSIAGSFTISADGYTTNELQGVASSHNRWRVHLRSVLLKKP
jgi:hypothetical protein